MSIFHLNRPISLIAEYLNQNCFPYPIIKVIFIETNFFDIFISNPILAKKEAFSAIISIRNEKYTPKFGMIVG